MQIGDLVTFVAEGTYAKWFWGQMGIVTSCNRSSRTGELHCRVEWLKPVEYFNSFTSCSDFQASCFMNHGQPEITT